MKAHELIGRTGFQIDIFWDNQVETVDFLNADWLDSNLVWVVADVRRSNGQRITVSFDPQDDLAIARPVKDKKIQEAEEYIEWLKNSLPHSQGYMPGYIRRLVEAYDTLLEAKK